MRVNLKDAKVEKVRVVGVSIGLVGRNGFAALRMFEGAVLVSTVSIDHQIGDTYGVLV